MRRPGRGLQPGEPQSERVPSIRGCGLQAAQAALRETRPDLGQLGDPRIARPARAQGRNGFRPQAPRPTRRTRACQAAPTLERFPHVAIDRGRPTRQLERCEATHHAGASSPRGACRAARTRKPRTKRGARIRGATSHRRTRGPADQKRLRATAERLQNCRSSAHIRQSSPSRRPSNRVGSFCLLGIEPRVSTFAADDDHASTAGALRREMPPDGFPRVDARHGRRALSAKPLRRSPPGASASSRPTTYASSPRLWATIR